MCWSSTKTTLLVVAVMCMCMNGFNLVSRMTGIEDTIREQSFAAYLPDVTDISKWVNGRDNSDHITEGLAGVSLIFDTLLLGGAMKESANLIQISGLWGSFDCVADAVIGFLAANYTWPGFFHHEETKTVSNKGFKEKAKNANKRKTFLCCGLGKRHAHSKYQIMYCSSQSMKRRYRAKGFPRMLPMKAVAAPDDKDDKKKGGTHTRTEKKSIGLREPPPTTAKQLLHFAWVILRLIIKSQILCSLFAYVAFLRRRDEMSARAAPAPAGGGATSMTSVAE
ncbi:hypothetical protein MTO96_007743 [Rhipicephalus appendiculatus]